MPVTDEALCVSAQGGDVRAAGELVRRHLGTARQSMGRVYSLRGMDHDDLLQESRIGLLGAIRDWRPGHVPFERFAKLCVARHMNTRLRLSVGLKHNVLSHSERTAVLESGDVVDAVEAVADERDPLTILIQREELRAFMASFARLSPLERRAVIGMINGLSYEQIADAEGRSQKTVDNALTRARRKIQRDAA